MIKILENKIIEFQKISKRSGDLTLRFKGKNNSHLLEILKRETSFLDEINPTIGQRLYFFNNKLRPSYCLCGKINPFSDIKKKIIQKKTCGDIKCLNRLKVLTNNKKYGVDWQTQSENFKKKSKKTWIKKYGVDNPRKSEKIKKKIRKTNLKNYGMEYPIGFIMKNNVNAFNNMIKSGYKNKKYKFPSGKTIKVQGYEPRAIDLILENHNENDIITNSKEMESYIGKIFYIGEDNKEHRYYPDIYIKSKNKIIEVKSQYYYKKDLEKNLLKEKECISRGFKFEFIIF